MIRVQAGMPVSRLPTLIGMPRRTDTRELARALRCRDLLQPVDDQGRRRELARARKAAFADPPTGPHQVWQWDFSEDETTTGGIGRLAGVADDFCTDEHGWHIAPTCPALTRSPR